jgi:hypothetical protein
MNGNSDFEHGIKNYMTVILGYTDLLLDEGATVEQNRADLLEIRKAAMAAVALVDSREAHK